MNGLPPTHPTAFPTGFPHRIGRALPVLAAMAAGALSALAFPRAEWTPLAWLGPGLWLLASGGPDPGSGFRRGWWCGLGFSLVAYSWLRFIPAPPANVVGWLALSAYTALFPALWVALSYRWLNWLDRSPPEPTLPAPDVTRLVLALRRLPGFRSFLFPLGTAILWVGVETFQGFFLTGFPWNQWGTTQFRNLPLIQIASIGGVAAVSFLLVWTSTGLLLACVRLGRRPLQPWAWMLDIAPQTLAVAVVVLWGWRQLPPSEVEGRLLRIALVQPSIPQTVLWDPDSDSERFDRLLSLTRTALEKPADLLLWPEAALPAISAEQFGEILGLVREHGVWMIFGGTDAEPAGTRDGRPVYDAFNSALLLNREGRLADRYRKRRLVIFGEYIPLEKQLPWLKHLLPISGSFARGRVPVNFHLEDLGIHLAPLICFEDIFAPLARSSVGPDTDALVNLTNNGWFGESAAHWQHAAGAVFRAIENRVPLVRCTNNGLSCTVDPWGRLRPLRFGESGSEYAEGVAHIQLALPRPEDRPPPFHRHGNRFGGIGLAFSGLLAAGPVFRRLRNLAGRLHFPNRLS